LTGLETSRVTLVLSAESSAPEVATLSEPAGGLVVTRAFVSLSSLAILPCEVDAADILLSASGYELVGAARVLEEVTTAVQELCGIRLDIDPLDQNSGDGVPEGASIYLEGEEADGTPFQLASSLSQSLLLEAESGVSFGALPLLVAVDVGVWLKDINPTSPQAPELLAENLASAVLLYADVSGNHLLDEDERTPIAWVR
jgi:hypothetical protein